ncbi:unnamed protein product [Brugia pahangi]|uniref:Transposase n=1 Tax=Brugia pahangi TaxID=6280 RepID=A0A0N4TXW3_BRUPA|nr:unnamed protein product [Brugia pahangi]
MLEVTSLERLKIKGCVTDKSSLLALMLMYRRQIEHSRRLLRRGVVREVPVLEKRTVWRDRSLSPAAERDQYVTENTLSYHQNRFERRENFMNMCRAKAWLAAASFYRLSRSHLRSHGGSQVRTRDVSCL